MGDNLPINAEEKQVIEQQNYLSDDFIIEEILTRLPVKSVLRFKSVSKHWYSTLSSSDFVNAHLKKSPFSQPCAPVNTLFIKNHKNYYLFSYDDYYDQSSSYFEDNFVKLDVDFKVKNCNVELTGSCNGLICLTIFFISYDYSPNPSDNEYFIIWNPATRELQKYKSDGYLEHIHDVNDRSVARGFGYASSIDDYKYVRIKKRYRSSDEHNSIVHIFSLREKKWRKIEFDLDTFIANGAAVLVDEKLNWRTQDANVIISFDLNVERFDIIHFNSDLQNSILGGMGGCLSMCGHGSKNGDDNLIYTKESSHQKARSICLPKGLLLTNYSQMIGFTRTGKVFVTGPFRNDDIEKCFRDCRKTLGLLDTGRQPMQHSILKKFYGSLNIVKYVPSLVSPFPVDSLMRSCRWDIDDTLWYD